MSTETPHDRARRILDWTDKRLRLRGIRLPVDFSREFLECLDDELDQAVSAARAGGIGP